MSGWTFTSGRSGTARRGSRSRRSRRRRSASTAGSPPGPGCSSASGRRSRSASARWVVGVERLVRGPHVGQARRRALGRHDLGGEHRTLGLHRHVGAVVVPALVAPQGLDAVVVGVAVDRAVACRGSRWATPGTRGRRSGGRSRPARRGSGTGRGRSAGRAPARRRGAPPRSRHRAPASSTPVTIAPNVASSGSRRNVVSCTEQAYEAAAQVTRCGSERPQRLPEGFDGGRRVRAPHAEDHLVHAGLDEAAAWSASAAGSASAVQARWAVR